MDTNTSRRRFLGTAAGLTGAALATGAWRQSPEGATGNAAGGGGRTFSAGGAELQLGTMNMGALRSVEGGWVSAKVMNRAEAGLYYFKKELAEATYDDVVLEIGLSMKSDVYAWINDTWTGKLARKDGAIVLADFNGTVQQQRDFTDAVVTETTIPACDASSKEPGFLTVKFAAETVRNAKGSGKLAGGVNPPKGFTTSNFRFVIDGLDASKVVRVDAFKVTNSVPVQTVGQLKEPEFRPRLGFGEIALTIPAASASGWEKWADDFIVKGNNDDADEKSAMLGLFAADMKTYLAHVDFFNVGIFRYDDAPVGTADGTKHVIAHLYCERAEFHLGAPSTGGGICPTNPCILPAGV